MSSCDDGDVDDDGGGGDDGDGDDCDDPEAVDDDCTVENQASQECEEQFQERCARKRCWFVGTGGSVPVVIVVPVMATV